jgi:hypothetical protein
MENLIDQSASMENCIPVRLLFRHIVNSKSPHLSLGVIKSEWFLLSCFGQMQPIKLHLAIINSGHAICSSEKSPSTEGVGLLVVYAVMLPTSTM